MLRNSRSKGKCYLDVCKRVTVKFTSPLTTENNVKVKNQELIKMPAKEGI